MNTNATRIVHTFKASDTWILGRAVSSILEGVSDRMYTLTADLDASDALEQIRAERVKWAQWLDVRCVLPGEDEISREAEIKMTPEMIDELKWAIAGEMNECGRMIAQITPDNLHEFDADECHDIQSAALPLLHTVCALAREAS